MANILEYVGRVFKRKPDKPLKEIAKAINDSLNMASDDLDALNDEYKIPTSGGEWLEEWGSWFNVYKDIGETDNEYRGRILSTVSTPKNTIPAIKQAVATYLSSYYGVKIGASQIDIYEPYTNLIKYSEAKSTYSGDDRYPDSLFWRTNVISIIIPYGATQGLKQVLETIKPAGLRIQFDVQLVPEPENPGSGIPEPVLLNTMIPIESVKIFRNMQVIGTDGFFHPFMDSIKYSGVKNVTVLNVISLQRPMVQLLSPVKVFDMTSYLRYFGKAKMGEIKAKYSSKISFLSKALSTNGFSETKVKSYSFLSLNNRTDMKPEAEPKDHIRISNPRKASILFPSYFPSGRMLGIRLGGVPPLDIKATYDQSIVYSLNYNDDEFNIKLSSAYTLSEIGDAPLSKPCWINGATDIQITKIGGTP